MKRVSLAILLLLLFTGVAQATVNEVTARNDYTGNGSLTNYTYSFRLISSADIEVYVGTTLMTLNTHYTVGSVGSASGTVTFVTPPGNGVHVTFLRKQPLSQLSIYQPNEAFPATRLNNDFDKATMQSQMQNEQLNRSLHIAKYVFPFNTEVDPTGQGNKVLCINASATGFAICDPGGGGGGGGNVTGTGDTNKLAYWTSSSNLSFGPTWSPADQRLQLGTGTLTNQEYDDSIIPGPGLTAVLGTASSGDTTGRAVAYFQKFSGTDIQTNSNATVVITNRKIGGTGLEFSRTEGLFVDVTDTIGWDGIGPQAFAGASVFKATGLWPAGRQGSVQPLTLNAIVDSPATNFGFVNGLEIGMFNRVADKGLRSPLEMQAAPGDGGWTSGIILHVDDSSFNNDVAIYIGNPYAPGNKKFYHGIVFRDNNIDINGNFITSTNFNITQTGRVRAPDGNEATPTYSFGNSEDAGMYAIGSGGIGFAAGGTNWLRIGNTGFVQIMPSAKLVFQEWGGGSDVVGWRAPSSLTTSYDNIFPADVCLSGQVWQSNGSSPSQTWSCATVGGGGGGINSVTGTADRITVTGTATDPVVNIAATYVGQATITTVGTVTTGTWNNLSTNLHTNHVIVSGQVSETVASRGIFDFSSGAARIVARGADTSTQGAITFNTTRSDGSNLFTPIVILANGNVGIGTGAPSFPVHLFGTTITLQPLAGYAISTVLQAGALSQEWTSPSGGIFMDWNVQGGAGDYDARLQRDAGVNSDLSFVNRGSGKIAFYTNNSLSNALVLYGDGGVVAGNATGLSQGNGKINAKGFFKDGVEITAGGIIGSGVTGQCTAWSGVSSISGNNMCTVDHTSLFMTLTKNSVNDNAVFNITGLPTGTRVNVGAIAIHDGIYGTPGPTNRATIFVPGQLISIADNTTYNSNGTNNKGAPTAASVVSYQAGASFNGIGHSLLVQGSDVRSIGAVTLPIEQDFFNVQSLVVASQTVNGGAVFDGAPRVNTVAYYGIASRTTAANVLTGMNIVISNFVNDQQTYGVVVSAGDAVDASAHFTGGDAFKAFGTTAVDGVEAWTNFLKLEGASSTTRWRVLNSGVTNITPSGNPSFGLYLENTGSNGAVFQLTGNSTGSAASKFIRVKDSLFDIIANDGSTVLLQIANTGATAIRGGLTVNNDANFGFSLIGGNPAFITDSGTTGMAYDRTNTKFSFVVSNSGVAEIDNTAASGQTNLLLLINNGSVVSRQVKIDAINTCNGASSRCLYVDN